MAANNAMFDAIRRRLSAQQMPVNREQNIDRSIQQKIQPPTNLGQSIQPDVTSMLNQRIGAGRGKHKGRRF